jgi:hypothetical protein
MAELDIYIESSLLDEIAGIAIKQYGDDSEASRRRVVETALEMRILWSGSIVKGQDETEEATSQWQFPESTATPEDKDNIRRWMFRR